MQKDIHINLDLKRVTAQPKAIPPLVEGDNGNNFHIHLSDDSVPLDVSDCKILAVFSKTSDGSTVEQDTEDAVVNLMDYGIDADDPTGDTATIVVTVLDGVATLAAVGVTATVDSEVFVEKFPDNGDYQFDYDGEWQYGANSVVIDEDEIGLIHIHLKTASFGVGKNNCELQIYSGANNSVLITTAQFNFDARKGIVNSDTIKSEDKYPILTQLIAAVQGLRNGMESIIQKWSNPTASATSVAPNNVAVSITEESGHKKFNFSIPSPIARVTKVGMKSTIHIEDENGTTEAEVSDGTGVPAGGTTHQFLAKRTNDDGDVQWVTPDASDISASGNQTVQQALDGEASARASADSTLQNNLQELYPAGPYTIGAWESNTHSSDTDGAFPYRAAITCIGVTSAMRADVVLGVADAMSGNYSPLCDTGNGVVYIWANDNTLTPNVQSIIVHKGA